MQYAPSTLLLQTPTLHASDFTPQSIPLPATHAPATHASLTVHGSLSASHSVPSPLGSAPHWPVPGSHAPLWHASLAPLQSLGLLPALQTPLPHTPLPAFWHLSAGSHAPPSAGLNWHVLATQLSAVHGFLSSHSPSVLHAQIGVAVHVPPLHALAVHAFSSSHLAASLLA